MATRLQVAVGAGVLVCAGGILSVVESRSGAVTARPLRFHSPLIKPDGRISRIRLSDQGRFMLSPTGGLWHATLLAVPGALLEVVGLRHSPLLRCGSRCLGTEAPSLDGRYPLPHYYEPLRHPPRPGRPLAGCRLGPLGPTVADFPCSSGTPLRACHHHYSGGLLRCTCRSSRPYAPDPGCSSRRMPAFPQYQRGRRPHCPFRIPRRRDRCSFILWPARSLTP